MVKVMDARATARAVWMGTPKPTVRRVMVTPAPPAPTKPITAPKRIMEMSNMGYALSKKCRFKS
jgi:hypothetical protein